MLGQNTPLLDLCEPLPGKAAYAGSTIPDSTCRLGFVDASQLASNMTLPLPAKIKLLGGSRFTIGKIHFGEIYFQSPTCGTMAMLLAQAPGQPQIHSQLYPIHFQDRDLRYQRLEDEIMIYRKIRRDDQHGTYTVSISLQKEIHRLVTYFDDGLSIW